jgi:hypothetical protein
VLVVGVLLMAPAFGDVFELNYEFSGATPPSGAPPWLTASFSQYAPDVVELVMTATNLVADEFVTEWFFNLNPKRDLTGLGFTHSGGMTATTAVSLDGLPADGGGLYDIRFAFPNAPPSARFGAGDTSIYRISGDGLLAGDFSFLSAPHGGHGTWVTAAHVQGIGLNAEDSGWVAARVPEPAVYGEFGAALAVILFGFRRLRQA